MERQLPPVPWWFDVLAALRTPLIWWIVVPMSFVANLWAAMRNWYFFTFCQAPLLHQERVANIQQAVLAWHRSGRKRKLCTSRSAAAGMNTRMPDFKDACNKIDVSSLRDVLHINEDELTMTLEPLCDMGYVSRFLVPRGLALQCLPEMDDLTIGGLINGYGVSTQSHKYGTMQDAIVALELVLPDGRLITATASNEHADLFRCVPWSHGTLGILVSATVKLVRVKPFVRMHYIPCYSLQDLEATTARLLRGVGAGEKSDSSSRAEVPDFFEATLYSPTTSVVQAGYFCRREEAPHLPVNRISMWFKPWFYKHVEGTLATGKPVQELLPLRDYYHRHTKSIYWELEDMIPFGNQWWYRLFFGWLGAPKVSLVKATQGVAVRRATLYKHVCQEFMVPLAHLRPLHERYLEAFNTYPLLLYVIRVYDIRPSTRGRGAQGQGFIRAPEDADLEPGKPFAYFAELGAYGVPSAVRRGGYWDAVRSIRGLEAYARSLRGYQCLCFDTLQTREEFYHMFDHQLWSKVRQEYDLDTAFPDVFTKVRPERGVLAEAADR